MRRKSKGEILREKIKEALVPADECPYEVPENWCWVRQNVVCKLADGEKRAEQEFPYLEVKYLRGIKNAEFVMSGKYIEKGSKVILVDGENSGEVFSVDESGYMGSTFKQLNILEKVNVDYIQYFIDVKKEFYKNNKKGSAIPHLNKQLFFNMPLPLPPLAEQERIVDRIESLFAKLDEAKEKVQQVLDESENRRNTILHKAFTGELTSKWREENNIEYRVQNVPFEECIKSMQNGLSKRNGNEGENIPVLRLANFGDTEIIENNIRPIKLTEEEKEKYILHANDILMVRVNGSRDNVGKVYNVNSDNSYAYCDHIIRIVLNDKIIDNSYYIYFTYTKEYREYIGKHMVSSAGQNTISRKGLKDLYIPICTLNEQQKIVTILDDLLQKEYQIFDFNTEIINKIDNIKKSILAKAFRGELGTNNPSDGNAIFLLKNVLEEQPN